MKGPMLLGVVWACLLGGLLVPSQGPAPVAPAQDYPLPSDEGPSLMDAWAAAWALANGTDGPWRLHGLDGFESVRGFGPDGSYAGRADLVAGAEALDGRIQADGFWQFLFRGAAGQTLRITVDPSGEARTVPFLADAFFLAHAIPAAPRFDTPEAVLACRRLGADEYLSEMDETFVYYFARPIQDEPEEWMLFIIFSTLVDQPGEIESASCRLHQRTGTLVFIDPEALVAEPPSIQLAAGGDAGRG